MTSTRLAAARAAAADAAARAAAHAEDWGAAAAPRRPRNGHVADCPVQLEPFARSCRHCRAERIARPEPAAPATVDAAEPGRLPYLRPCGTCHAPTDLPEDPCDRCRRGSTEKETT